MVEATSYINFHMFYTSFFIIKSIKKSFPTSFIFDVDSIRQHGLEVCKIVVSKFWEKCRDVLGQVMGNSGC